jgi:hypothetical protein
MDPNEKNRKDGYAFTVSISRHLTSGAHQMVHGVRDAQILYYNSVMDYAIIEDKSGSNDLTPIPISIRVVDTDVDLKVFHCPVALFNDEDFGDLTVYTSWVKSAKPTKHHSPCSGGLFAGSSGAPFVTRDGFVVGFHVESINSARAIETPQLQAKLATGVTADLNDAIELVSETVNSNSRVHASLCRALCIGSCSKLVETIERVLRIPIHR